MSLLFCDSFQHYLTPHGNLKWIGLPGTIQVGGGRRGGNCGLCGAASVWIDTLPSGYLSLAMGGAFYFNGFYNEYPLRLGLTDGGFECMLMHNGDGRLFPRAFSVNRTDPISVSGDPFPFVMQLQTWYYIELQALFSTAGLGRCNYTARFQGTGGPTFSGQLDAPVSMSTQAPPNQFVLNGPNPTGKVCDVWVTDGELLGDQNVDYFPPSSGAGYQNVNAPDPPESGYNVFPNPGDSALYGVTPNLPPNATIAGIQGLACVQKDANGPCSLQQNFQTYQGNFQGAANFPSENAWSYARDPFRTNPLTGLDFTVGELNAGFSQGIHRIS